MRPSPGNRFVNKVNFPFYMPVTAEEKVGIRPGRSSSPLLLYSNNKKKGERDGSEL
jgi:hypothetical protein